MEQQDLLSDYHRGGGNGGRGHDMDLMGINSLAAECWKNWTPPLQAQLNSVNLVWWTWEVIVEIWSAHTKKESVLQQEITDSFSTLLIAQKMLEEGRKTGQRVTKTWNNDPWLEFDPPK